MFYITTKNHVLKNNQLDKKSHVNMMLSVKIDYTELYDQHKPSYIFTGTSYGLLNLYNSHNNGLIKALLLFPFYK